MVEVLTGFRLLDGLNVCPPISDRRARTAGHWDTGKVCRLILLLVGGGTCVWTAWKTELLLFRLGVGRRFAVIDLLLGGAGIGALLLSAG